MTTIDLNSDLGEGYGQYVAGDDARMLDLVTSANVACGFHAGDPEIMAEVFTLAKANSVAVGAHPGFPDLWGFGRRRLPMSSGEIERMVAYQVGAAQALAAYAGHRVTYVKAHGALGNIAAAEADVALAIARAVKAVDPTLVMVGIALSEHVRGGEAAGLRVVHEVFADRAFGDDRQLVPRGRPGAMIEGTEAAAAHVLRMVQEKAVFTLSGARIPTPIDTICVHGDSIHAVDVARTVRARLEAAGIGLRNFGA